MAELAVVYHYDYRIKKLYRILSFAKPKHFFFQKYLACVAAIYFKHDMNIPNYPFNCKEEKQTHNSAVVWLIVIREITGN